MFSFASKGLTCFIFVLKIVIFSCSSQIIHALQEIGSESGWKPR